MGLRRCQLPWGHRSKSLAASLAETGAAASKSGTSTLDGLPLSAAQGTLQKHVGGEVPSNHKVVERRRVPEKNAMVEKKK